MSTKILLVDDESLARAELQRLLSERPEIFDRREAANGFEALELIATWHPDIVILDIEMPELSGLDLLRQLPECPFKVIFQTAYQEYAIQAFEQAACDYLLKPIGSERFHRALNRALANLQGTQALAQLEAELQKKQRYLERLVVKVGARTRVIAPTDILCFLSESHVTQIVLGNIDYAYDHSLSFLEQRLDPQLFIRVHRNCIINVSSVISMQTEHPMSITLCNGSVQKVARERRQAVLAAISGLPSKQEKA